MMMVIPTHAFRETIGVAQMGRDMSSLIIYHLLEQPYKQDDPPMKSLVSMPMTL